MNLHGNQCSKMLWYNATLRTFTPQECAESKFKKRQPWEHISVFIHTMKSKHIDVVCHLWIRGTACKYKKAFNPPFWLLPLLQWWGCHCEITQTISTKKTETDSLHHLLHQGTMQQNIQIESPRSILVWLSQVLITTSPSCLVLDIRREITYFCIAFRIPHIYWSTSKPSKRAVLLKSKKKTKLHVRVLLGKEWFGANSFSSTSTLPGYLH